MQSSAIFGFDYANGVYAANLRELHNDALNVHNIEWKNKAAIDFIEQAEDEPFFLYYSENINSKFRIPKVKLFCAKMSINF